jgi:polar amino acid transport system permease protein
MRPFLDQLAPYLPLLMRGAVTTCKLCAFAYMIGMPLGLMSGYVRHRETPLLSWALNATSILFKTIPFLVILFWLHYPLQQLLSIVVSPLITGTFALSALCATLVSDSLKFELNRFPKELIEMGSVLGVKRRQLFLKLQVPYLIKATLPQILSIMITVLHASLFCSFISVEEIFRVSQALNTEIYRPVEIYSTMALALFLLSAALFVLASLLRKKWRHNEFS